MWYYTRMYAHVRIHTRTLLLAVLIVYCDDPSLITWRYTRTYAHARIHTITVADRNDEVLNEIQLAIVEPIFNSESTYYTQPNIAGIPTAIWADVINLIT